MLERRKDFHSHWDRRNPSIVKKIAVWIHNILNYEKSHTLNDCYSSSNINKFKWWECSKFIIIFDTLKKSFRLICWEDQWNCSFSDFREESLISFFMSNWKNIKDIKINIQHKDIPKRSTDLVVWWWCFIIWELNQIYIGWQSVEYWPVDEGILRNCLKWSKYDLIIGIPYFFKRLWDLGVIKKFPANKWQDVLTILTWEVIN